MSGEFEAAGAAVTAGLAAKAIEGRSGTRHGDGKCLNCGADLSGKYCSACGQPAHVHRTLGHVFEEFLHGVLHFDTKAWRTLPLLAFRPGTLTYNYIHGTRARYISPLAMFLFAIFTMFFVFAFVTPDNLFRITNDSSYSDLSREELDGALIELARDEARLAQPDVAEGVSEQSREGMRRLVERRRHEVLSEIARRDGTPPPPPMAGSYQDDASMVMEGAAKGGEFVVIQGADALNAKINEKLRDPQYYLYKVQQNAYKFSFLLVPISLPFVALLFLWKRGWTLYDHVVFTLYSQAFMSLLFIVVSVLTLSAWTSWLIGWLVLGGIPVHMFFHLKGTYKLGWWSALWRTLFLLVFAIISLTIFIVLMFILGAF